MNVRRIILYSVLGAIILGSIVFIISPTFQNQVFGVLEYLRGNPAGIVKDAREEFYASPLTGSRTDVTAELTVSGVITETNYERATRGYPVLTENEALTKAAEAKIKDMFDRQYFEHVSPDGRGPGYIAQKANYNYIVVGENLALGNFKDDRALVDAWMNSTGHRANILNERFTEIGVAVGRGMYNGSRVWMAVQEFGKPASDCPVINQDLAERIEVSRSDADKMSIELGQRKKELDAMPQQTREEQERYNEAVAIYNDMVRSYNGLVAELRTFIAAYNEEVRVFNACIRR